jgi:hypothetical protein
MLRPLRGPAALIVLVATLGAGPARALDGARLEGIVLGTDGRAAAGLTMHLVDGAGHEVGRCTTSAEGLYAFDELPAGDYSLAAADAAGRVAPVAAPPVRLGPRSLGRRDVRLMHGDESERQAALAANPSLGLWWAGMSPAARAWTVVGLVIFVALTVAALDNGDDAPEQPASP